MTALPDFEGMSLFVKIMDAGSISAAGRAAGLPKATVSRRLADLEARLGVQLVNRTTRSLSFTDAGRAYFDRCAPIVAEAEAAEAELRAKTGALNGKIRLSAAAGFGQIVLMPLLQEFLHAHPGVSLDLDFSDRHVDVVAEGFDLAVRMGELADSSLVARRLQTYPRLLVASPAYLAKAPALERPEDLRQHACILTNAERQSWNLETDEGEKIVRVSWRLAVQNIFSVRDAALAGLGVAMIPRYVIEQELASGTLLPVLPGAKISPVTASALFPAVKSQPLAVRRLVEFLVERSRHRSGIPVSE